MSQQIRTKWHNLWKALGQGDAYFTAPYDGMATAWDSVLAPDDIGNLLSAFSDLDKLPRFVIAPELHEFVRKPECQLSFLDMKKADVLRLPYPAMMIELPHEVKDTDKGRKVTTFVMLRDLSYPGKFAWEEQLDMTEPRTVAPFYAWTFALQTDETGEYVVAAPVCHFLDIADSAEGTQCLYFRQVIGFFDRGKYEGIEKLIVDTYERNLSTAYYGLFSALLMMTTQGVDKEVIECEKLNRKRVRSNKQPIPRHTYIYIKRVYRSAKGDESELYDPRRPPRVHWRRAHNRSVAYGKGRMERKVHFFPGRLVALPKDTVISDNDVPFPTYVVKS